MNGEIQKMNIKENIAMNEYEDFYNDSDIESNMEYAFEIDSDDEIEIIEDLEHEYNNDNNDNNNNENKKPIKKIDKKNNNKNKKPVHKPAKVQENKQPNVLQKTLFKDVNYKTCSNDKILEIFSKLKKKWIIDNYKEIPSIKILQRLSDGLGIGEEYDIDILNENYKLSMFETRLVYQCLESRKIIKDNIDDEYVSEIKKITEIIHYAKKVLSALIHTRRTMDPTYDSLSNIDQTFDKCSTPDLNKAEDHHRLLLYLLKQLADEKCGRYQKNYVCQQKYINGYATHFWEKKWEVKDFIEEYTNPHSNYEMWLIRENPGNYRKMIEHITEKHCYGYFPDVNRMTGVWAFRNGVYNNRHIDTNGRLTWKFYAFESDEVIPGDLVASVFYDQDFTANKYTPDGTFENWRDIPTPHYDSITRYQFEICDGNVEEIYDLLMVLIGRVPAPIGVWDKWEVFIFLVGMAGCGKSMILLNVIGKMFDDIDIGHLENENETKFGWSPFKDKKVIIATEISKSFNMSAQLFQKMVSGEHTTLASKNEKPIEMKWTAPFVFGGNEMFDLTDSGGAIARRTIVFNSYRPVLEKNKNTQMPILLANNIGNIIHKSTCAYLEKRERVGTDSLWNHLPQYFLDKRDSVMSETNPFYSFITSDQVEISEEYICDMHEFKMCYSMYLRQMGMHRGKFTKDTYIGPFAQLSGIKGYIVGVKREKNKHMDEDGKFIEDSGAREYIVGLKIVK